MEICGMLKVFKPSRQGLRPGTESHELSPDLTREGSWLEASHYPVT